MSQPHISDRVKRIIHNELDVEFHDIRSEATLKGDFGAEEDGLMAMVLALEKEFELDINQSDASRFHTVHNIIAYIERRCQELGD